MFNLQDRDLNICAVCISVVSYLVCMHICCEENAQSCSLCFSFHEASFCVQLALETPEQSPDQIQQIHKANTIDLRLTREKYHCYSNCYLFFWMESLFSQVGEAPSPLCRSPSALPYLLLRWLVSPKLTRETLSSWTATLFWLLQPFPLSAPSAPASAAGELVFRCRLHTALKAPPEESHGSVCSLTQGWTRGKRVERRTLVGGRKARKVEEKKLDCTSASTDI